MECLFLFGIWLGSDAVEAPAKFQGFLMNMNTISHLKNFRRFYDDAYPDSKIHGANVGHHVGHTNVAICVV